MTLATGSDGPLGSPITQKGTYQCVGEFTSNKKLPLQRLKDHYTNFDAWTAAASTKAQDPVIGADKSSKETDFCATDNRINNS